MTELPRRDPGLPGHPRPLAPTFSSSFVVGSGKLTPVTSTGHSAVGHHLAAPGSRGKYGVDGGVIPFLVYGAALAALTLTFVQQRYRRRRLATLGGLAAVAISGSAGSYFYSTGRGKRSIWTEILDALALRGTERVLDIGCGRGAVLMLAARRVPEGKAVGVDVWRLRDQSGNNRAMTERNAVVEGVSDRVEVLDGDARELPFPDGSFDLVVSNLALHNIRDTDERTVALREAVRVLRPGGRLRIVDLNTRSYVQPLRDAGCRDLEVHRLDWRTWCGVPGHHLDLVEARV